MSLTAFKLPRERLTEEEFLEGVGQEDDVRYEFVDGRIYAMATPTDVHAFISANIFTALHMHLRGKPCRVFMGNMLLRIKFINRTAHYIPDVMVACDREPRDPRFREEPLLLVEVLSENTREHDEREKLFAYTSVASLKHYLLVHQDRMEVSHYWRSGAEWQEKTLSLPDQVMDIPDIEFTQSLAEIYTEVRTAQA